MTDNPMMIMVVNMAIVFVVLFLLGLVIELIHKLDPTKNSVQEEPQPSAPIYVAPVVVEEPRLTQEEAELVDYETVMDQELTERQ
ncbi:MAG: OadG family protein [Selenomonadales bacterium]|jgi:glutaconyl-CoA decarboxylase|nr:OadG family protein [Selenomonadales bacterium]MBQ2246122.1 OadG family protein [Selenomonadales bacterium]MBQ5636305.1 OadG family protein [Selenomonadales bacterium]MBQ5859580.1 OadG family protein [Selenomonadales bacterium]MBR0325057.1 OadG family protein [Selenomonadales bacterium]